MGDKDSICGFAALGLATFSVTEPAKAGQILKNLVGNEYAVIYITEKLAELIEEEIEKYRHLSLPAIILIPGISGNTGKGLKEVLRSVERAVGSDIIS